MAWKRIAAAAVAAGALWVAGPAGAQTPQDLNVRSLAATCANCHGTQGQPVSGSTVPGLAGMPRDAMLASMKAFRDGTRPATIMHQIAKGYSEAQLAQIAAYFAAQKK
ncbi:c-type cytochrome [Ramlibacter sp.]|uniref:c-type cytochrome n=1 Tax=Ramlibacter sp. TaxID=1917967 RepID=UPI003D0C9A2C